MRWIKQFINDIKDQFNLKSGSCSERIKDRAVRIELAVRSNVQISTLRNAGNYLLFVETDRGTRKINVTRAVPSLETKRKRERKRKSHTVVPVVSAVKSLRNKRKKEAKPPEVSLTTSAPSIDDIIPTEKTSIKRERKAKQ